jgi:hypothetical protein
MLHLRYGNHLKCLNNFHHLLHALRCPYELLRQRPPRRLPPSKLLCSILFYQLTINNCKYGCIIAHLLKLDCDYFVFSECVLEYEVVLAHDSLDYCICLLKVVVYFVYHGFVVGPVVMLLHVVVGERKEDVLDGVAAAFEEEVAVGEQDQRKEGEVWTAREGEEVQD